MIDRLIAPAHRHPAATLVAASLLVAGAATVGQRLKLDALPDITPNQVLVLTVAPGLTPDEVERRVTRPVEVALGGVPDLVELRSLSRYGVSSVVAVFEDSTDPLDARQLVSERVSTVELPEGVEAPALGPLTGGLGEVLHFTLRSAQRTPEELLELAELRVVPILQRVDGVVEVNTWGGAVRTFEVRADAAKLAARGLVLDDVRSALEGSAQSRAGSAVATGQGQAFLRGQLLPSSPEALEGLVVDTRRPRADDGHGPFAPVRLHDVARTGEGRLPRLGAATADGKGELVYVMVQMLRGANALDVVAGAQARMGAVQKALPADVELNIVYDRRDMVIATLKTVAKNLIEGGLLVMAVLFLLLGSLRAGLIVALTIPLSMIFALMGMVLFDVPGNLMSLGAIDFGLLVDGAVVMIETLFHRRQEERDRGEEGPMHRSVAQVMARVARPVFFAVLIIVLVYVPILTLAGVDGKLFRPMAFTVILALLAALALSLTAVPAAAALWLRPKDIPEKTPLLVRAFERIYRPALEWAVGHRPAMLILGLGLLALGAGATAASGSAFVPQLDEGDLVIQTTRAADIRLDQATAHAGRLERVLVEEVPEVLQVVSRIGSPAVATDIMGLEQADVFVRLKPRSEWRQGLTREALIDEMQELIDERAPGGDPAFTQPIQMRFNEMLGGDVSDVTASIYGQDLRALRAEADALAARIEKLPGAVDVRVMAPPDVLSVDVRPRPYAAARAGLSIPEVLNASVALKQGVPVATTWRGPLQIPIVLRLRDEPTALEVQRTLLPTPGGGLVPLGSVADVDLRWTPSLISRQGGERRMVVGFNIRGAELGEVASAARRQAELLEIPDGMRIEWGGQAETLRRAQQRLLVVVPSVLALILLVLTLAFRRVRPALIIFSHVPLASVGGAVLLWLRGMPISISAAIGFIALSGIAVLNGVVLMNELLRLQAERHRPADAAVEAARSRARPVLMTALVAALGFLPMALATGVGAEVQRPLATVVVGGLVTSTVLTLLILPSLYPWFAGKGRGNRG